MWIRIEALLCCILATTLATNESRSKKKDDSRGKRTLDYTISHNHSPGPNTRLERRISAGIPIPQLPQYPLFYPIQKPFAVFRKGRPNAPAPPYAVQMEPVVHYSQPDPLYDESLADGTNDLKSRDLVKEETHNSRVSYAYPPAKHIVERPIYIKEPEPIIEIIIKESNVTLPPLPTPPAIVAPRKKEQVQVFYVKYQKNPNVYGKDSIVYDKPVPALTPHVREEVEPEPQPLPHYEALNTATLPPPPSTTLRAIVKPESETYHADKGIHITFGKTINEQRKRSNIDSRGEPTPEQAHSRAQPQARQYNPYPSQPLYPNRPQENGHVPQFRPESTVHHNDYRNPPQPAPIKQTSFNRGFSRGPSIPANPPPQAVTRSPHPSFTNPPFPPRPTFNNQPIHQRQPVPYQPFEQTHPQPPQVQFPRTPTHFPVNQQNQQLNNGFQFNQQQFQNSQRPEVNTQFRQQQPTFPQAQHAQQQFIHHQQQPHNSPQQAPHQNQIPQQLHQNAPHPQSHFSHNINHNQQVHTPPPHQNQIPQHQQPQSHFPQQNINHNQHVQTSPPHQNQIPQHQHQNALPTQSLLPQQNINHNQQIQTSLIQNQQNLHFPTQQRPQFPQQRPSQPENNSELLRSLPKYEQHVSFNVPSAQTQPQKPAVQQPQVSHHQPHVINIQSNQQDYSHLVQQQFRQNAPQPQQNAFFHQTPSKPISTSPPSTTTPSTTTEGRLTEKDLKELNIQLPDEVPADLREQLLSSGILKNAQISVLDYDKIGDTSIADLPPDQLANFFSAGGGQLGVASENVPVVVRPSGDSDMEGSESSNDEVKVPPPVEMKVVRYDPDSREGQQVPEAYIEDGAKQLNPVSLDDQQYTRYLPVKVNGAAFPIPDVPELKGRNITSVVVLAPVDLNVEEPPRRARDVNHKNGRYLAGEALKNLIKHPTTENFRDWLDKENNTIAEKQAVILLVAGNSEPNTGDKEIFMYDLGTQTVNKLSGELSSAFVDAAETNSGQDLSPLQSAASNVVETRIPYPNGQLERKNFHDGFDLEEGASKFYEAKIPVIDPASVDGMSAASEQFESSQRRYKGSFSKFRT
ncbi:hypothetical protein PPYR_02454 [Photinus pyralis]|uniref:Uncharacterized protein n=1 Tax=Photinus pyralis TaxID=7054 RepID=A0A5N4B7F3_PHOPY|nr:bromodomain-containing protein 4-like isoform X2 [Photinus pyralis]KAB0805484.1 hypothetical protein PPYR_02454 [Photinus pyralis]